MAVQAAQEAVSGVHGLREVVLTGRRGGVSGGLGDRKAALGIWFLESSRVQDVAPDVREAYMMKNRDMQRRHEEKNCLSAVERTKANLMSRMLELESALS